MNFGSRFIWGTATSAYQIEGAWNEGGKGPSIWDDLTHDVPDFVDDQSTGDVACDHFHRFREDIALMAKMGVKAYRFSISWPRVLPAGTYKVNESGIRFYSDLVDCLLSHGIRPFVTLYHWDLPRALHERGGWLNESMVDWFSEYTTLIADRLGNRVKDFFTINEPQCIIGLGYSRAEHAPALVLHPRDLVRMSHILMRCHGRAVKILRDRVPGCRVGYAPCSSPMIPVNPTPEDIKSARDIYFGISEDPRSFMWNPAWFSDPVMLGQYPDEAIRLYGKYLPDGWRFDLKEMCQPLDYYAQNIYQGTMVRDPWKVVQPETGISRTLMGWPVTPEALYWGPKMLYERYHTPIIITENGMSCPDCISADGSVHDPQRIEYIRSYLKQLSRAINDGVKVDGYFYWSFMDNFEWKLGYTQRFGLVYVDYKTQRRIPKDSFDFYSKVIKTGGACLG